MSKNIENATKASRHRISQSYAIGLNSSKRLQVGHDVQLLAQHIITYMQRKNPKFQFKDFSDSNLIKSLRNLIKNQKQFNKFLNNIHFTIQQFFTISVYLVPHVYTSYLIKFIKEKYLANYNGQF